MSNYRGKIVCGLYFLSQFFTTMYGMEKSIEDLSFQSLGSLCVRLKEDVSTVQREQQKQKKSLKEIREEQRYQLLIMAEVQRDQNNKEIKKLERKITRCAYKIRLQLKMLDWNVKQKFEQVEAQISRLVLGMHRQQEKESAHSLVLFESSLHDGAQNSGGWFVAASPSSDDSYSELT